MEKTIKRKVKVFNTLSHTNKMKVLHIYNIANMLKSAGVPPLTAAGFDYLYDKPLKDLDNIIGVAAKCSY